MQAATRWQTDSYRSTLANTVPEYTLLRSSPRGADMIRIRATDDGTYTVYRDDAILVTGLTRDQADDVARSLKTAVVT